MTFYVFELLHTFSRTASDTYKTAKINYRPITSWTEDIIRTTYYIHGPWCDEINVCCFICVTQWWALHVVIKRQLFTFISDNDELHENTQHLLQKSYMDDVAEQRARHTAWSKVSQNIRWDWAVKITITSLGIDYQGQKITIIVKFAIKTIYAIRHKTLAYSPSVWVDERRADTIDRPKTQRGAYVVHASAFWHLYSGRDLDLWPFDFIFPINTETPIT